MYKEIEGGTLELIDDGIGGHFKCYLPPLPEKHKIAGFNLPKKEQKWKRTELPQIKGRDIECFDGTELEADRLYSWEEASRQEEIKITGFDTSVIDSKGQYKTIAGVIPDEYYLNPILERFRLQEWARRIHGFWFMNNGKPTYITGACYMYLNWTFLENSYPKYFDLTRQNFYCLEHCWQNPKSLGYLELGSRGYGKSTEKLAFQLDKITQPPFNRKAIIQSKTEEDAKVKQFQNKVVSMFNRYPSFFKPRYNHGSNPKNGFSFFRDTLRGKSSKGVSFQGGEELGNTLIPVNAGSKAIDGETVSILFCDEVGKVTECDAFERHQTNRETVYRSAVGKTGVILAASTVEEMEKGGGKECKKIWDASDRGKIGVETNGFTVSGMDRRFIPCWKCAFDPQLGFLDDFGVLNEEGAKAYFDRELLSAKRDSQEAYLKRLRMYPMRIEDCFISPNASSPFAVYIINSRLRELNEQNNIMRFNFRWENNIRYSRAIVEHDENGCWASSWLKLDKQQTNLVQELDTKNIRGKDVRTFRPINDVRFRMGIDPIDHKDTVDSRASRPVAFIKRLFDPIEDDPNAVYTLTDCNGDEKDYKLNKPKFNSNRYIAWFDKRLDDPNDIYEQIMLGCWYFGCQVHVENQKRSIINYFNDNGHSDFVMYRPQETFTLNNARQHTEGTPGVNPVIDQYINMIATYVVNFGHLIDCVPLLEDLRDFERKNIRFHDYVVAMGFTEMAALGTAKQSQKPVDVTDLFRIFNNQGSQSSLLLK